MAHSLQLFLWQADTIQPMSLVIDCSPFVGDAMTDLGQVSVCFDYSCARKALLFFRFLWQCLDVIGAGHICIARLEPVGLAPSYQDYRLNAWCFGFS